MRTILAFVFATILLVGCGPKETSNPFIETIETIDSTTLQEMISQRNGALLFVNVWATWCVPCKEEFPDLIRLVKKYKSQNVEFVGISADYPDEIETRVKPFLRAFDLNFKIYVQDFENDEEFINLLNREWSGALPATFIYDQNGIQRAFLLGKKSMEEFEQELIKLL